MRIRILIIDPNPHIYMDTKNYLMSRGYEVRLVVSVESMNQINFQDFNLILIEPVLPMKDGWDLLKTIRQDVEVPL